MIVPGKILVIDDVREQVEELLASLGSRGEYVVFSSGMPDDPLLVNVRLLILDLYLVPNDRTASVDLIIGILDKLDKQTRFFLIAIWSKFVDGEKGDELITELKSKFKERTNRQLKAIFLKPFGDPRKLFYEKLVKKIEEFIAEQPETGLVYESERILEDARDRVVSDIVHAGNMGVIIRALERQVGKEALERCMLQLFTRILNRYTKPTKRMKDCIEDLIEETLEFSQEGYAKIHCLQAYYHVKDTEPLWTGDVLMKSLDTERLCYVVISPACDFAQKKLNFMRVIHAERIEHTSLSEKEGLKQIKKKLDLKLSGKQIVNAILSGRQLPKKYYVLQFLEEEDSPSFFHLILDFDRVEPIPFKSSAAELEDGWKRLCRIDDPWISDILQRYSSHSSRIGIFEVPQDVIKKAKDQIG